MKKTFTIIVSLLCLTLFSNAQLNQGNWLVGGKGRFAVQKQQLINTDAKGVFIDASPNIGYFPADKFAAGLRLHYGYDKVKSDG